jgi:hypothetical protein
MIRELLVADGSVFVGILFSPLVHTRRNLALNIGRGQFVLRPPADKKFNVLLSAKILLVNAIRRETRCITSLGKPGPRVHFDGPVVSAVKGRCEEMIAASGALDKLP